MPRANRRRPEHPRGDGFERMLAGYRRTETRGGREWNVQPVSERQAVKSYTCPGCARQITPGTAHVVAWPGDGILGDAADLASRRHWHTACWRLP